MVKPISKQHSVDLMRIGLLSILNILALMPSLARGNGATLPFNQGQPTCQALHLIAAPACEAFALPSSTDTLVLTLAEADSLAMKRNASVPAGQYRLVASQADIVGAGLYPNPQLSYNTTYINLFAHPIDYSSQQSSLRLDQSILLGGKISSKTETAEHSYAASQSDYAGILFQLSRDVKANFIDVAYDERTVELARRNYELFKQLASVSETRLKAGDIGQQDLDKIELSELNSSQALSEAEQALTDALAQLHQTLGLQPSEPIKISYEFAPQPKAIDPDTVLAIGMRSRADVRSAQERLLSAKSAIDVAHADAIPDLDVGVEWDKAGPDFKNAFGGGLGIAIPLFTRSQDEIQRSEATYRANQYDLEATLTGVRNTIKAATQKYQNAMEVGQRLSTTTVEKANRVRDNEVKNYTSGNISLLDLLQTQQLYSSALSDYYTALYRIAKNQVALERAVGVELF
jgi:cobalt-zinc-cadmium efflux system outer membrane protein